MRMGHSIAPMQLLVSIVERGKGGSVMGFYRQHGLYQHIQASGRGTAASHLLDTLGFGTSERDVILTLAPRDDVRRFMRALKDGSLPKQHIQGLLFSMGLTGMSALLAVCLSQMGGAVPERSETVMEQSNSYSLILAAVNQGFGDTVMDTARAAGAWGATVIRARLSGAEELQTMTGVLLREEREVLAIMVHKEERNGVMEAIEREHGAHTPAQALVISLPIEQTARLD